MTPKFTRI